MLAPIRKFFYGKHVEDVSQPKVSGAVVME